MKSKLRELKSAKIKVKVLQSILELLGTQAYKDLYVEDICKRAKISKVTFFKYFSQKEDVLLYYYRKWCFDVILLLKKRNKQDITAIRVIFDHMAATYDQHPGLILGLISYLTSLDRPPAPFPFKPVERELLFPDVSNVHEVELLSLPQLLEKCVLEAIFNGKILANSNTKELTHQFMTLLYGSIVTCHLRQVDSLQQLFKRNIDTLLKGLNPA